MIRLSIVVMLLALQSCYVTKTIYTENIFNSWIGKSSHDLIVQQGAPTQIVTDGRDGQVYVYDRSHLLTSTYSTPGQFYTEPTGMAVPGSHPSQLNYQPGSSVSNQMLIEKKVEFFVNKEGHIYAWHSTGYPDTYKQRYTKEELTKVDQSLFVPPASNGN